MCVQELASGVLPVYIVDGVDEDGGAVDCKNCGLNLLGLEQVRRCCPATATVRLSSCLSAVRSARPPAPRPDRRTSPAAGSSRSGAQPPHLTVAHLPSLIARPLSRHSCLVASRPAPPNDLRSVSCCRSTSASHAPAPAPPRTVRRAYARRTRPTVRRIPSVTGTSPTAGGRFVR